MSCDLQVLARRKNNPNETVYEELKIGISRSFAGVGYEKREMMNALFAARLMLRVDVLKFVENEV